MKEIPKDELVKAAQEAYKNPALDKFIAEVSALQRNRLTSKVTRRPMKSESL